MSRNVIAGDREVWRSGPVTAVRYGKVVTVYLPSGKTIPGAKVGANITVARLEDGWRPAMTSIAVAINDKLDVAARLVALNTGELQVIVGANGGNATDSGMMLGTSMSLTFVC